MGGAKQVFSHADGEGGGGGFYKTGGGGGPAACEVLPLCDT